MTKKIATAKPKKSNKTTPSSGVGAASSSSFNIKDALAAAASLQGQSSSGRTWTAADSDAAVQGIFQQMLGRNAQGTEYAKALSLINSASSTTAGITQAVQDYVAGLPEYQARSQDKWLGAIYDDLAKQMARAQA